jgi:16S rRNA (guanine966-N2)-methyltransferase
VTRIIAGRHRGRRLAAPPGERTRPTTDRVREALFSAIAAWSGTAGASPAESLAGLAFADLYAGSGAVGLEAASRGAAPVLLVESSPRTAAVISRNITDLRLEAVSVRTDRVERLAHTKPARPYEVVFLDPPYGLAADAVAEILDRLVANGWVANDGLLVVERSRRDAELRWPPPFAGGWRRDYGETTLLFGCAPEPARPETRPDH